MPYKVGDTIMQVTLPVVMAGDSHGGTLYFAVSDSAMNVSNRRGRKLGSVVATFGAGWEVQMGNYIYRLNPKDLWFAVTKQLNKDGSPKETA